MGPIHVILYAILLLIAIAVVIAILRPIYTMKVVETNIYENRLSFWKYVGTVIIATIIVYTLWFLLWLIQSRTGSYLIL